MRGRIVVLCLWLGSVAEAQTEAPFRSVKTTVIDFEDEVIGGERAAPAVESVNVRTATRHETLVRVPKDFRQKVLSSTQKL
jgi:hypothetical protein